MYKQMPSCPRNWFNIFSVRMLCQFNCNEAIMLMHLHKPRLCHDLIFNFPATRKTTLKWCQTQRYSGHLNHSWGNKSDLTLQNLGCALAKDSACIQSKRIWLYTLQGWLHHSTSKLIAHMQKRSSKPLSEACPNYGQTANPLNLWNS